MRKPLAAGAGEVTNLYSVTYNTNNSTGGTTPATQTAETSSETYTFAAPQQNDLVRTGYGLAGWSENPNATSPEYTLGGTITLSKTNPSKTLYAVWISPNTPAQSWNELFFMQQMTPTLCAGGDTTGKQLVDFRDNKKYWVAKLKDGNCWMTQNLDLDLNGRTLSTTDSDVTSNWTSTTGASALWNTTGNNDIKYYDPGDKYCPNGNCSTTNSTSSNNGHDAQGNYYSFNAATAGTGQSYTTANQNAPSSICPKGWRLPISNTTSTDKSFGKLLNGLNTATIMAAPYYYIYGGLVNSGSLYDAGSYGYYWSSTAQSATGAYSLYFGSSNVYPSDSLNRYYGFSVRCVAR